MNKFFKAVMIIGLAAMMFTPGALLADQYAGGTGDGWATIKLIDFALGGPTVTISSAANQYFNISAAANKAASAITISDATGSSSITAAKGLRIVIPASFGMQWEGYSTVSDVSDATFSATSGAISSASVTLASSVAGTTGSATVSFTNSAILPGGGKIVITFPAGFIFNSEGTTTAVFTSAANETLTASVSGQVLTLSRPGGGANIPVSTVNSVALTYIKNPNDAGNVSYTIATQNSTGSIIDSATASGTITNGAALTSTSVLPTSLVAGVSGNITATFTTINPIPSDGKVIITLPAGYDVSGISSATSTTLTGTLTPVIDGQKITVTRSGVTTQAIAGTYDLTLGPVTNPTTAALTGVYTIQTNTASASSTTGAIDTNANITGTTFVAAAAASVNFATQPASTATAGAAFTTQPVVKLYDAYGNICTNDSVSAVTLAAVLASDGTTGGGGTLSGILTKTFSSGVATFSDLYYTKAENIKLKAYSGSLSVVNSSQITMSPASAAKLGFITQPSASNTAGSAFGTQPVVAIQDTYGNTATAAVGDVTLAIGLNMGGGTLSGTKTVAAVSGLATFSGLSIEKTGEGYILDASSTGLATINSNSFTVAPNTAAKIVFVSGAKIADYATGSNPYGAAFDPSTNSIWVANYGSNTVSKFDASTGVPVGTYITGDDPMGVCFDPANRSVWVTNASSTTVSKFSATNGTKQGTYTVGTNPYGIAFDSATNSIWVSNYSSNNISKVSTTGLNLGTYTVGTGPRGVAFDSATNSVWVTNYFAATVSKLSTTGLNLGTYTVGANPFGVAFDSVTNSIWVANNATSVSKLNVLTGAKTDYNTSGSSYGIAFDPSIGSIWVTNTSPNIVIRFDAATGAKVASYSTGTNPYGAVFDPSTRSVWVTNYGSNTISKFNAATASFAADNLPAGANSPAYIITVRDAYDNLRTADSLALTLASTSASGKFDTVYTGTYDGATSSITTSGGAGLFYYKDTLAGAPTLTASYTGLTSGTLAQTVVPAAIAKYTLNAPGDFAAGTRAAYSATRYDKYNNLKTVQLASGTRVGEYVTGTNPYGAAFDPSTNSIWVANYSSNTVSKFQASTGSLIGSYATGIGPSSVAFDSSTNSIWVANYSSNTVSKFQASTGSLIGSYATGTGTAPYSVDFDSSTNSIWVGNATSNTVSKFQASTGSLIGSYATGIAPTSVAFDSSTNSIWVANVSSNTVSKFQASTGSLIESYATGIAPYGVAFDSSTNSIWVANATSNTVSKFQASTGSLIGSYAVGAGTGPYSVAFDSSTNSIWVANYTSDTVSKFQASTGSLIGSYAVGFKPRGVTFDPSTGSVWVINRRSNSISKLVANDRTDFYVYSAPTNASFYDAATDGNVITSSSFAENSSIANFWYTTTLSGAYAVTISDNAAAADGATGILDASDNISAIPAPANHLKFASSISDHQASVVFTLPQIKAMDAFDNVATAYAGIKTLSYTVTPVGNAPDGNASDSFTTSVTFADGVSTTALSTALYRSQATTITPVDSQLSGTNTASNSFTVNPLDAVKLVFTQEPSATAVTTVALTTQPKLQIRDTYGNRTVNTDIVKLYASSVTGTYPADYRAAGGVLGSSHTDNSLAATSGEAIFSGVNYDTPGTIYLYAEAPSTSLLPAFSTAVAVSTGSTTSVEAATTPVANFTLTPTNDTIDTKFDVLKFKVHDQGSDSKPTLIDRIKVAVAGTGANAATDIAWAGLYVDGVKIADAASIANDYITFGAAPGNNSLAALYTVADNTTAEFTVAIYMKDGKLTAVDKQTYTFGINESDIGVDSGVSSQMRANAAAVTTVTGAIGVSVSHIEIVTAEATPATSATITAGNTLELLVRATDINHNIDKDYTGNHTLAFAGPHTVTSGSNTYYPKIETIAIGYNTTINFSDGVSASESSTLTAYKSEAATLVAQESGRSYGQFGLGLTVNPAAASSLVILSGNNQSGKISYVLANPFVVQISDTYGNNASAGTSVTFAVAGVPSGASGTSLSVTSGITDSNGQVSTLLTTGSLGGTYTVSAASTGLIGSPLTFTSTGLVPSALSIVSGNGQTGTVAANLTNSLVVKVADAAGTGLPNEVVTFAIASYPDGATGQALSATSVTTDTSGQASTVLTLGNKSGAYTITASSGSLSSITLASTAAATTPYKVVLGGPVSVIAGETSTVYTVSIQDQYSNASSVTQATAFNLATAPVRAGGKFYSDATALAQITSLTIPANSSSSAFYYKDTATGTANLAVTYFSGQALTTSSATQSVTIAPAGLNSYKVTGNTDTITAGGTKAITITAYDLQGNVKTNYSGDANIIFSGANLSPTPSANPATCTDKTSADVAFGASTSVTFAQGVATATLKLYKAETAAIKATSGSVTTATADALSFIVAHAEPNHLKFSAALPASVTSGGEFNFDTTLNIVDLYSNICTGANGATAGSGSKAITWTLSGSSNSPDGAAVDAFVSPVEFNAGVSTTTLKATLYRAQDTTLTASTASLSGTNVASSSLTVRPAAVSKLTFSQEPSATCVTSVALAQQPKVSVADQYGNAVTSTSATVSISACTDTNGTLATNGTLSATGGLSVATVNGVATFAGVTYTYPENIYLKATVSGVSLTAVYSSQVTFNTAQEANFTAGTLVEPTELPSTANSLAGRVSVLDFKITDGGTDGYGTKVKQIVVKRDTTVDTTSGWANYIAGAYITDGITQTLGIIEGDQITFGSGSSILYTIANSAAKTLTVSVYLKASLPAGADGKVFAFKFDPAANLTLDTIGSRVNPASAPVFTDSPVLTVTATNFLISGASATMNAGSGNAVTLTAVDASGNIDTGYSGDKEIVFSGASVSANSNKPTASSYVPTDVAFGTGTIVSFASGVNSSTITLKLYAAETATITATDGALTTSAANSFVITVSGGSATSLAWKAQPAVVVVKNAPWAEFSVKLADAYGNTASSATAITVVPSAGSVSAGALATATASSGVATFYTFAVNGLTNGQKITLTATASGVSSSAASNTVTVYDKYAVTLTVKDYATSTNLSECTLTVADANGVIANGFPKSGSSPFTFSLPYDTYTFTVTKEAYVDAAAEKVAGVAADYLDGAYDAAIAWTITATSLAEATSDYSVESAFVYDESTDKLSIKAWLTKRGNVVTSDEVNSLGTLEIKIYNDTTNEYLTTITVAAPSSSATGLYSTEIAKVVASKYLTSGKTYFAKLALHYGGTEGTSRTYETGTTFAITVSETLKSIVGAISTVTTGIAAQTAEIKGVVKDEIKKQVDEVVVPKITDVKTETAKILTATGTESLQEKIADVKTQVVEEIQPSVKSGILNRENTVKQGNSLTIRYRTTTGLAPVISVYSPKSVLLLGSKAMKEVGATGVYEYSVTFLSGWGLGDFTVICSEPSQGTVDALVITVAQTDLASVDSSVSAVLGNTGGITNLKNVTTTLSTQFNDMDKVLAKISKDMAGKVEGAKGAVAELSSAFKQLEDLSKQIKDIGGTTGINLEKLYEVSKDKREDITYIKNKSEELKAAMEINQKMIENVAKKPVVQTWFEFK